VREYNNSKERQDGIASSWKAHFQGFGMAVAEVAVTSKSSATCMMDLNSCGKDFYLVHPGEAIITS
jgi:hypothetical protein